MTISRSFITAVDDETGVFGFMPRNMPAANTGDGISVAHDTMEHIYASSQIPAVDEILAIGACTWLRFQGNWKRNDRRELTASNIGASVGATLIDAMHGLNGEDWSISMPLRSRPIRDARIEETLIEAATRGVDDLKAEAEYAMEANFPAFCRQVDKAETQTCVLRFLRLGYRHARKRYYGLDPYEASILFSRIADEIDALLQESCTYPDIEIKVAVSPTRRQAKISLPRHIDEPIHIYA